MANLDTNRIWQALGTFFSEYFPEEERRYWDSYWLSFADICSDLWGYAYQIDQCRSVFSAPASYERLNVMLNPVLQEQLPLLSMQLCSVSSVGGVNVVRGFVPRSKLSFKKNDIPGRGLIRIGVDVVPYVAVNVITVPSGPMAGYVSEATFTLGSVLPHNYVDTIDLNESFTKDFVDLAFRVPQVPGQTYIDATSDGVDVTLDQTGLLEIGVAGYNRELLEYQSFSRSGDRYVFTLPSTFKAPGGGVPPKTSFFHAQGERVRVSKLMSSTGRWQFFGAGPVRVYNDSAAVISIDNEPSSSACSAVLSDTRRIQSNTDFDMEVTLILNTWMEPTGDSDRAAGFRVSVGPHVHDVALRTRRVGATTLHTLVATTPDGETVRLLAEKPERVVFRIARTKNTIELQAKVDDEPDFRTLSSRTVPGLASAMELFCLDTGTGTPSLLRFDEIVRRLGQAVGSQRLESSFTVSDSFPWRYSVDVNVATAPRLQEEPKARAQNLKTVFDVAESGGASIRCEGVGDDFFAAAVPQSGVLVIAGKRIVYDSILRVGPKTFDFFVRGGKIDPDLIPIAMGTDAIARTRTLSTSEFQFNGDSTLWLRDPPTRSQLWAPLAHVDEHEIQKIYGPLVGMDAVKSSESYARRVQGAFFALMNGPAIENVHIGVHLALGLPAAKIDGVVTEVAVQRDAVGRVIRQTMTISGADGVAIHELDPGLPSLWSVGLGDRVEKFQPLTSGVEVLDVETDPNWGTRFGGTAPTEKSLERWNAFGVLADVSALGDDASIYDAVKFAIRIRPLWAKLYFSFTMGELGHEHLQVSDDSFFTQSVGDIEDISFDHGTPPLPGQEQLRMGDGHKMGWGKFMGDHNLWKPFPFMSPFLHMGIGLTMGMEPRVVIGDPDQDGHAYEALTATAIEEVDV